MLVELIGKNVFLALDVGKIRFLNILMVVREICDIRSCKYYMNLDVGER